MTFMLCALKGTPVYQELATICRSYSIMYSPTHNLEEGGSGVFATYAEFSGVLTATHVMAKHISSDFIISPLLQTEDPTIFLTTLIPIKHIHYLETPEGLNAFCGEFWPSEALDICFIELDPEVFKELLKSSGKQAVDLLAHKKKYLLNSNEYCDEDHSHDWCWAFDGAPREGAFHNPHRTLESKFDGLYVCGGAMDGSTYKSDRLTLVRAPFDKEADRGKHDLGPTNDPLPDDFSGVSGAGMWQIRFRGENGIPQSIDNMFFSGICVAAVDHMYLTSRGPSALYDIFTSYLDTLLKSHNSN